MDKVKAEVRAEEEEDKRREAKMRVRCLKDAVKSYEVSIKNYQTLINDAREKLRITDVDQFLEKTEVKNRREGEAYGHTLSD